MTSEEPLFAECGHCKGTGSHFETPDYRWTGVGRQHDGLCSRCGGRGLIFSDEGQRIRALVDALGAYPKARSIS